jgi:D-methionine transport system ATP-binding protein
VIRLENLHKAFSSQGRQVLALAGVELEVAAGRIQGLIGPSGAGKSTLLRCVNLLERPTSGRVRVAGQELTELSYGELARARRGIGMIFQQPNLMSSRRVRENVALPLELAGRSRTQAGQRVEELLALVGLLDKRDDYPAQLSGGQRQRATIARALATEPSVLLCDEATSALDPNTTRAILGLLRDINRRLGITLLVVTHELEVVRQLCDDVALLDGGRIIEAGPVAELFARPRTALMQQFIEGALGLALPEEYRTQLVATPRPGSAPLVRLTLAGKNADLAVLSVLARQFGLDATVVSAHTDYVAGAPVARVVSVLRGGTGALERAQAWLAERGAQWEEIGHVAGIDRAAV